MLAFSLLPVLIEMQKIYVVCFFSLKIVTLGDLKPEPVLWHEDTGRRHGDNGRYGFVHRYQSLRLYLFL